jgi:hypothetical protein
MVVRESHSRCDIAGILRDHDDRWTPVVAAIPYFSPFVETRVAFAQGSSAQLRPQLIDARRSDASLCNSHLPILQLRRIFSNAPMGFDAAGIAATLARMASFPNRAF